EPGGPITINDRQISGILLDQNRDSGSYRVGLLQQRAGGAQVLYFTPGPVVDFRSPGTVKIGNFRVLLPEWMAGESPRHVLSFDSLLVVLVVALLVALSFLAVRKIAALAREGAILNEEVVVLLEGRKNVHWEERKKHMQVLKKRGMGLRLKFTLLMVVLVIMIVLIVSIPLGFQMVNRQRLTLATGLKNDANLLLGALSSSAQTQFALETQGFDAAPDIPKLRADVAESVYTTITGPDASFRPTDPKDFVWASDEKRFADELAAGRFRIASETVDDELARSIVPALQKKIDTEGMAQLGTLVEEYRSMSAEQRTLVTRSDATSRARSQQLRESLRQVSQNIAARARLLDGAESRTLEPFDPAKRLASTYLFYKPVVFYKNADNVADTTFYQGMIRLQVKTDAINKQIDDAIAAILRTATLIALAAIALGVLGAIIMASITVTPIRKLAAGVATIRDTEKKEELKDHVIEVGTRDEIGQLADTVNQMTQGLVKAAIANNDLLVGKDVQKMFLPLEKDAMDRKGTTAEEQTDAVEIYGYYEGAKGVSGDYFDFKKLDDTHYALIKCDVAGKGVPAALIMVEVATLFISYFRDWVKRAETVRRIADPKARAAAERDLERIDQLVYTINDMLEERGFRGRFAALTICIFNSATGVATVCNAGDTLMHVYEAGSRRMVQKKLPDSPAAGVFPSMMVELKSGFRQVPQKLVKGDAIFLFTDGFEE
ncbi:MAG TPA: SpoIIE family protein phosphatase, partial [Spirochaetia bacterium]